LSNPFAIVNGKENITDYRVINIEQLEDVLNCICKETMFSIQEKDNFATTLETFKVNKP
jgi:uncharacterized protein YfkK (UPF0435 family)